MSHDSHQATGNKPGFSFMAAFWVVLIIAGVFICAVNFIKVMGAEGAEEKGGKEGAKTEMAAPATEKKEAAATSEPAKTDTTHTEKH